jgi:hypothetical protein
MVSLLTESQGQKTVQKQRTADGGQEEVEAEWRGS